MICDLQLKFFHILVVKFDELFIQEYTYVFHVNMLYKLWYLINKIQLGCLVSFLFNRLRYQLQPYRSFSSKIGAIGIFLFKLI